MDATEKIVVEHEPERHRFVARVEDELAVLEYAPVAGDALDFYRTYVPPALRGRGIASDITAHALDYALQRDIGVVPSCPFVDVFIDRHPRYRSLRRP